MELAIDLAVDLATDAVGSFRAKRARPADPATSCDEQQSKKRARATDLDLMDLAMGALEALLPKLGELLKEKYQLQMDVRKDIEFLLRELRFIDAALRKLARLEQLDEQLKIWADDVRELSRAGSPIVDIFLVRVEGSDGANGLMKKLAEFFKKVEARNQIAVAIKELKDQAEEVAARRDRYNFM